MILNQTTYDSTYIFQTRNMYPARILSEARMRNNRQPAALPHPGVSTLNEPSIPVNRSRGVELANSGTTRGWLRSLNSAPVMISPLFTLIFHEVHFLTPHSLPYLSSHHDMCIHTFLSSIHCYHSLLTPNRQRHKEIYSETDKVSKLNPELPLPQSPHPSPPTPPPAPKHTLEQSLATQKEQALEPVPHSPHSPPPVPPPP